MPFDSEGDMKVQSHTYARDVRTGEHRFMLFNEEGQGNNYGLSPLKIVSDATMFFLGEGDEKASAYMIAAG